MSVLFRLPCFLPIRRHSIGIEGAQATAAPDGGELLGRAIVIRASVAELIGEIEEGAEQGGAIVVGQLDKAGFLHQAAQLDQMAGAFAAYLGPIAHVGASLSGQ